MKKIIDNRLKLWYNIKVVKISGYGGIGRRAWFRSM